MYVVVNSNTYTGINDINFITEVAYRILRKFVYVVLMTIKVDHVMRAITTRLIRGGFVT